jgi:nucleotide-binding universal stress UspA family protein
MERAARMLAAPDQHDVPPLVVVNRVVGTGSVAASIVAAAEPGTLVCMTSHGAYGPARTLAGSVTEEVIRTTRTPVLLIGPQVHARDPLVAGAIVGCIGHLPERDRETVATARRWAGAFRLPLRLTHVIPRPDPALGTVFVPSRAPMPPLCSTIVVRPTASPVWR